MYFESHQINVFLLISAVCFSHAAAAKYLRVQSTFALRVFANCQQNHVSVASVVC